MNQEYPAMLDYVQGNVPQQNYFVHPNAEVSPDCVIGKDTRIWSGALVRNGTILGENVSVGIGCALEGCEVGDGTHLNPHVLAGPGIIIGKRCFLGGHVVICNDGWPSVDQSAFGGWGMDGFANGGQFVTACIGDDTAICTGAIVLPGVVIGHRCLIAAQAVVDRNVPDGQMFTRSGEIRPIDQSRIQRMKAVAC